MSNDPTVHPVHKAINKSLTILGAERRLFFMACVLGATTFNLFGSLMSGLLMFSALYWFARWATGTDPQILDKLNRAFNKAANSDAIKARLADMAYEVTTGPRSELFDLAKKERPVWAAVIRASGATVD